MFALCGAVFDLLSVFVCMYVCMYVRKAHFLLLVLCGIDLELLLDFECIYVSKNADVLRMAQILCCCSCVQS
jgi:hypothetical protein